MKLIPIASELIQISDAALAVVLTPPNKTNYRDILARITFEAKSTFANPDIIVRTTFNGNFSFGGTGIPYGHLDVLELENIEQIQAFSFTTNEDTKNAYAWVEYFNKLD